jgi:hypothetical protein
LQEVVIRGIVEVMDEREMDARSDGLHSAIERLSAARAQRTEVAVLDFGLETVLDGGRPSDRKRRLFRFSDRARRSVDEILEEHEG